MILFFNHLLINTSRDNVYIVTLMVSNEENGLAFVSKCIKKVKERKYLFTLLVSLQKGEKK